MIDAGATKMISILGLIKLLIILGIILDMISFLMRILVPNLRSR